MIESDIPHVSFKGEFQMKPLSGHVEEEDQGPLMFSSSGDKITERSSLSCLEEHDVITNFDCSVKVYVQKSKNPTPIVTFHDIGTNHNSFLGFFNYREMRAILQNFTVYHICAPGHEENANNLNTVKIYRDESNKLLNPSIEAENMDLNSASGNTAYSSPHEQTYTEKNENRFQYPTMDELADIVHCVCTHFGLKYIIGVGMGAGSNVLSRYTLKHQINVLGLFLINPTATTHGYYQWMRMRYSDLPGMVKGVYSENLMNELESHWFGYGLNKNMDLVDYYDQLLRSLNPKNVAGYIDSFLNRTDLGLVRNLLPNTIKGDTSSTCINSDVMLISGALAHDLAKNLAEMNGRMDPEKTQFILMEDCNGMVMEECPDKLALNFLYFIRNVGKLVTWTQETLMEEALSLQNGQMKTLSSDDPAELNLTVES